jgi:hypothetical protein
MTLGGRGWCGLERPVLNNHPSPFAKGTCISVDPDRPPCMRGKNYDSGESHFLTFSCYGRLPMLLKDRSRQWFVDSLDNVWCGMPWMNREHDQRACHPIATASPKRPNTGTAHRRPNGKQCHPTRVTILEATIEYESTDQVTVQGHFLRTKGRVDSVEFLSPSAHISWAQAHGRFRNQPLSPTDHPLDVAEHILAPEQLDDLFDCPRFDGANASLEGALEFVRSRFIQVIRLQAMSIVKNLIPFNQNRIDEISDAEWSIFLADARRRNIHWDAEKQTFTDGRNSNP